MGSFYLPKNLYLGVDIGSTTTKAVLFGKEYDSLYSAYRRHHGQTAESLLLITNEIKHICNNKEISVVLTGSAGMGLAEDLNIPFVQELISTAAYITKFTPEVKTIVDIGGEDSKLIFFRDNGNHDIRMNGSCAGGTGAYLDQMASLLGITLEGMDKLASDYDKLYPVASRCGVFAKTDVQNLLSRKIPIKNIAASIYNALAVQLKNSLLKGYDIKPLASFSGGPLTFLPNLAKVTMNCLGLRKEDMRYIRNAQLITAAGAAVIQDTERICLKIHDLEELIKSKKRKSKSDNKKLQPLFRNYFDFTKWKLEKEAYKVKRSSLFEISGRDTFLGIDSGSTTTKIVLIDEDDRLVFEYYAGNRGDPVAAVKKGLTELREAAYNKGADISIKASAVTGYGEELIRSAFGLDYGIVETVAHFKAAGKFDKDVSFILDIGGQDMKAIYVRNSVIQNIEINEACSSGCGSFIETFANSMNYSVEKFAEIACESDTPCDLGTRCTVFMNSRVKQSFREGSDVKDISAGLAFSVVNNCLHKVLKIHDKASLGEHIIVQGGTFRNNAVHRAFEQIIGRKVICPDISELMGAYGAAISAKEYMNKNGRNNGSFDCLEKLDIIGSYEVKYINCRGCENNCTVSKLKFENGNVFHTGNKCEKIYSNSAKNVQNGINFPAVKYDLLFNRQLKPEGVFPRLTKIGIPRALNFYENFPFWSRLFVECGFEVVLSDRSSHELYNKGAGSLMSDNICYPAKLVHGHIMNLVSKNVDRIFYPIVTHDFDENPDSTNCFNCPVVAGYPDVIHSSVNPFGNYGIPLDTPNITFKNLKLLKKASIRYLRRLGVSKHRILKAYKAALNDYFEFRKQLKIKAAEIIAKAEKNHEKLVVLAGRPYHIDPGINHLIPDILAGFGLNVITEDAVSDNNIDLSALNVITQWAYPNRIYKAAKWSAGNKNTEFILLNSFGCGPDSIIMDEVKEIIENAGKNFTLVRVDELSSIVSLRLRIRSFVESLKMKDAPVNPPENVERITTKPFMEDDRDKLILAPFFSPFHSAYIAAPFRSMGYNLEILPPSDQGSIDLGLKYVNNEICYPATIVIGDILKALQSGKYDTGNVAVGLTQTGGQCRASNYLTLLKKAMVKAGFEHVPVVAITLAKGNLNYQPGFTPDKKKIIINGVTGLLFGDALANMYFSTAPREKVRGTAKELVDKYNRIISEPHKGNNLTFLLDTLTSAVKEFNSVEVMDRKIPKIGVVGEVYVKNNPFGNNYIVDKLVDEGFEIIMPPLINMFIQWFVNVNVKHELLIDEKFIAGNLTYLLEKYFNHTENKFRKIMNRYRYYHKHPGIHELAENSEPLINMIHHYFGEGWMIAGDISVFSREGINDVLCLQPFGCLANHIVAKGIEKTLREKFPSLNILYIDLDYGMSSANIDNRLHLLMRSARKGVINHIDKIGSVDTIISSVSE